MSKSKENNSVKPQRRVSGSNVGLSAIEQGDEFFTDSILESDGTRTSKIPTPITQKAVQTKSRRSRKSAKAPAGKPQITGRTSDNQSVPEGRGLQPAINIHRSKSPSPLRNRVAATPPQTRIRTDIASPGVEIRSPPPEEFTDVYRQIAEEEDLAATERESSSSDDSVPGQSDEDKAAVLSHHRHSLQTNRSRSTLSPASRSSTPTRHDRRLNHRDEFLTERKDTMSENTGMSFLNELTDQQLAAKLTPHMSESAKDRAKLREVWSNQKPVAFTKVGRHRMNHDKEAQGSMRSDPHLKAFSNTGRTSVYESDDDRLSRPQSRHSDGSLENYAMRLGSWDEAGLLLKELPTNTRVERNFQFSRRHGFPQNRPALTEQNLEQQNRSGKRYGQLGHSSPISHYSDPLMSNPRISSAQQDAHKDYSTRAQRVKSEIIDLVKSELMQPSKRQEENDNSLVDWTAAGADEPLPSKETSSNAPRDSFSADAENQKRISPDKSRRWDIDLTGQSFQVSESPPVRSKPLKSDASLGREIETLTKRAVTTSRLGEIREKHSQEQLRSQPAPPVVRSLSVSSDKQQDATHNRQQEKTAAVGEPIPNTPVVIYRSNSSSSSEKRQTMQSNGSNGSSDEYLQRFARAMSSTPKSSPASTVVPREAGEPLKTSVEVTKPTSTYAHGSRESLAPPRSMGSVAETPKIVGGWTDTLLPDTVRTVKPVGAHAKYMQTPHVSAGGWIDTPLPVGTKKQAEMTPIVEEVPEELVNGIARGKIAHNADAITMSKTESATTAPQEDAPKVGLAGILDRAKQRLSSQDITSAARENDTLNLGNETIESLQGLLTLDADEFTVLSKVFNEDDEHHGGEGAQAEAIILERIGAKLDRLRNNIHEARKGISQLEHKVSQPELLDGHDINSNTVMCTACSKSLYTSQGGSLPVVAPLHLTIPIPILFHFEPKSSVSRKSFLGFRLPQPTPLGYFTLAVWLWYITECTLSEIYSHPTHADYYTWPSLHHVEPEFPYVLPTMLSRWFRLENLIASIGLVFTWAYTLLSATTKVIGMWSGWTDGFIDSDSLRKVANSVTSTAAASMGIETDMSMMNDEFL